MISSEFDESQKKRRRRIFNQNLKTAEKLNIRIKHFLKNVNENYSLTEGQKNEIKINIIKNL